METSESKQNTPLKRRYSRVTKFGYIVIFLLAILWLISSSMIFILTLISEICQVPENVSNLVEVVTEYLKIDVAGAIGTIASLVIARYGAREVSANIRGIKYDSQTEKDEVGDDYGKSINE